MTLNLISLTFNPYVSLFSVICMVVLACFGTFVRRLIRRKEPHVDLLPQVKSTVKPGYRDTNLEKTPCKLHLVN